MSPALGQEDAMRSMPPWPRGSTLVAWTTVDPPMLTPGPRSHMISERAHRLASGPGASDEPLRASHECVPRGYPCWLLAASSSLVSMCAKCLWSLERAWSMAMAWIIGWMRRPRAMHSTRRLPERAADKSKKDKQGGKWHCTSLKS